MKSSKSNIECPVCLGTHDEKVHAATVDVHTWWRESLMKRLIRPVDCDQATAGI